MTETAVVTLLFTDLGGSTELSQRLGESIAAASELGMALLGKEARDLRATL